MVCLPYPAVRDLPRRSSESHSATRRKCRTPTSWTHRNACEPQRPHAPTVRRGRHSCRGRHPVRAVRQHLTARRSECFQTLRRGAATDEQCNRLEWLQRQWQPQYSFRIGKRSRSRQFNPTVIYDPRPSALVCAPATRFSCAVVTQNPPRDGGRLFAAHPSQSSTCFDRAGQGCAPAHPIKSPAAAAFHKCVCVIFDH